MSSSANGTTITKASITMPAVGAWHCEFLLDSEKELTGAVVVDIEGELFKGTFLRGLPYAGATKVKVVGGGGELSKQLGPKNYSSGTTVRAVLTDICGAKEKLSDTSDNAILATSLPRWQRVEGLASHAIVSVLDKVGATWRVLADGTIWVGRETWPTLDPSDHFVLDEDWHAGVISIAPEAPKLRPGVTFKSHKLQEVCHYLTPAGLRTDAHITSAASSLGKFLGNIRRAIDYTKRYPARVASVNSDGSIQVVPDDAAIKGTGLDKVRVRSGVPGKITPSKGSRCLLGFDNGDPSAPYASDWDDAAVDVVEIANGGSDAASVGDTVNVFFPPMMPLSGTVNGTLPFVGVLTIPRPGIGIIQSGNPKVKL